MALQEPARHFCGAVYSQAEGSTTTFLLLFQEKM